MNVNMPLDDKREGYCPLCDRELPLTGGSADHIELTCGHAVAFPPVATCHLRVKRVGTERWALSMPTSRLSGACNGARELRGTCTPWATGNALYNCYDPPNCRCYQYPIFNVYLDDVIVLVPAGWASDTTPPTVPGAVQVTP